MISWHVQSGGWVLFIGFNGDLLFFNVIYSDLYGI